MFEKEQPGPKYAWKLSYDKRAARRQETVGVSGQLAAVGSWQLSPGTHVVVAGPSIIFCGTTTVEGGTNSHQEEVEPCWQAGIVQLLS